jgi:hypothetical protein
LTNAWCSPRIAEAFGVREDTVGPAPVKSETALRIVTPLLEQPVADRRNWTIPRLRAEIEAVASG